VRTLEFGHDGVQAIAIPRATQRQPIGATRLVQSEKRTHGKHFVTVQMGGTNSSSEEDDSRTARPVVAWTDSLS
jgi:hypothetical protein